MIQMQEILELSVVERIAMIEKIWDSLDKSRIDIPDSHKRELDRRLDEYKRGETKFATLDEVKERLAKLS
jgi:putative addiction module component (TIGR02574 family)